MNDEVIKLLLDMGASGKNVEEVTQKLAQLKGSVITTADTYDVLERKVGQYNLAARGEEHELDALTRKALEATQAHRAMAMVLDEMPAHTAVAAAGADNLIGRGGKGGYGVMGASYAVQDFVTVVGSGGSWGRAMMSMANNVTPVVAALGPGAVGMAGALGLVVTAASAGVIAMETWWKAADSDKADSARQKLHDLQAEIRKTNAEFMKLSQTPTDYEKLAAEGIGLVLQARPNADRARAAVAAGITNQEAFTKVDAAAFRGKERAATMTDEDIAHEALVEATKQLGGDAAPQAIRILSETIAGRMKNERSTAQRERAQMMQDARRAKAEEIVVGAAVPGPAGDAARRRLLELTRGKEGLGELQRMTPERIRADEEAAEKQEEADADEARRVEAMRARMQKAAAERKAAFDKAKREANNLVKEKEREQVEEARAEEKAIHADVDLSRRVGRAAMRPDQHIDLRHIPMAPELPPNPTQLEFNATVLANQQALQQRNTILQQQLREAQALNVAPARRRRPAAGGGGLRSVPAADQGVMREQAAAVREGLDATRDTQQAMFQMMSEFRQLAEQARMLRRNANDFRQRQQPMANNGWS